ncbi:MAG TPA: hypothetical protein VEZ14_05090 [Dehalococcoidia bacterium]|nr:hypothetical protein [Dehalococcoidia bacterium]
MRFRIASFVRRHWLGLAAALLLTSALAGPRWYLLASSPPDGARIQVAPWAASDIGYDLALFSPAIRDAYDGSVNFASFYNPTRRDVPTPPGIPWLEAIGLFGRVTGSPFSSLAVVTTLTALASLVLLYMLALELFADRRIAAATLPIAVMLIGILVQAGGVLPLRHPDVLRPILTIDPRREFHAWYRFVPPSIPLPVFLAVAIAIPRAVESGHRRWLALAIGALALLIYTYLFYWSAMAVALAGWCTWLLYRGEYQTLRRVLAIGVVASLLAAPELAARLHDAVALPADARARFGKEAFGIGTGQLTAVAQRLVIGLPFLYPLLRGPERNRFYIALFLAPLALDLTTGIVPQPEHYVTQVWHVFALPAFIAGAASLVVIAPRGWLRPAAVAAGALAVLGIVYAAAFQARATYEAEASFSMPSDERAAFNWIETNVRDNQTVVSPSVDTNMLLPAMTPARRYLDDGFFTRVSDDEIIDRFLRAQAAFGYSESDVFARLDPANGYPTSDKTVPPDQLERHFDLSAAYFLFNWEITTPARVSERMPAWRQRYEKLLTEPHVLSAFPADFLFCGHRERFWPAVHPAPGTYVTVAFQQGQAIVYKLTSSADPDARPFSGC